jgi:hypothetical protein
MFCDAQGAVVDTEPEAFNASFGFERTLYQHQSEYFAGFPKN